jgi:hypothetical protein
MTEAINEHERSLFRDAYAAAAERVQSNPGARNAEQAARELWDRTASDCLDLA